MMVGKLDVIKNIYKLMTYIFFEAINNILPLTTLINDYESLLQKDQHTKID